MQTRKPLGLVTKKKADNTDIKQYNFIVSTGNNNPQKKKQTEEHIKHTDKLPLTNLTQKKKTLELQGRQCFS